MGIGARHHRLAGFDRLAQTVQHPALEFPVSGINVIFQYVIFGTLIHDTVKSDRIDVRDSH